MVTSEFCNPEGPRRVTWTVDSEGSLDRGVEWMENLGYDCAARNNTFPGEVFMELAADALDIADTRHSDGVAYRELLSRHLPEVEFRGKMYRRIQYAELADRSGIEIS